MSSCYTKLKRKTLAIRHRYSGSIQLRGTLKTPWSTASALSWCARRARKQQSTALRTCSTSVPQPLVLPVSPILGPLCRVVVPQTPWVHHTHERCQGGWGHQGLWRDQRPPHAARRQLCAAFHVPARCAALLLPLRMWTSSPPRTDGQAAGPGPHSCYCAMSWCECSSPGPPRMP